MTPLAIQEGLVYSALRAQLADREARLATLAVLGAVDVSVLAELRLTSRTLRSVEAARMQEAA